MANLRSDQAELHNRLAGEIVQRIIRPVLQSGGTTEDILVLTESVLVGVALAIVKFGGDEPVLDLVFERAKHRLAELRLTGAPPAGSA